MALDVDNVRVFSYLLNLEWFGVIEGVAYTFYLNLLDTFLALILMAYQHHLVGNFMSLNALVKHFENSAAM